MKSILLSAIFFLVIKSDIFSQCPNGDFEQGNFTGFNTWYAFRDSRGINLNDFMPITPPNPPTLPSSHQIVTSTSTDPNFPALGPVGQGNYSARIGNTVNGGYAYMLGYTFTVTNQNKFFSFRAAIVLNYSTEHKNEQDQSFVQFFMCKGSSPSFDPRILINEPNSQATIYADDNSSGFFDQVIQEPNSLGTSFYMYKDWTKHCIDLSNYVGQEVSIYFIAAGCTATQHFGYLYLDEICGSSTPIPSFSLSSITCYNTPVIADGTNSLYEDDYFWTVEQIDRGGSAIPGTIVTNTFLNSLAGIIDLTQFYNGGGNNFIPGARYRITLGVRKACLNFRGSPVIFSWVTTTQVISIPLAPSVSAGIDHFFCCSSAPASVQLGSAGNDPGYQYQWVTTTGVFVSNLPMPVVNPLKSTTYKVTVTDASGCVNSDEAKVVYSTGFTGTMVETCGGFPCNKQLGLNFSFNTNTDPTVPPCIGDNPGYEADRIAHFSYLWNTGETTPVITVIPGTSPIHKEGFKAYNVTVSDGCQNQQTYYYTVNTYSGNIAELYFPNVFTPNGDGNNDVYYIFDNHAPGAFSPNAYNAYKGEFRVFNQWGEQIHSVIIDNCGPSGIPNGYFSWNGEHNGQLQPVGVYAYTLKLYNCSNVNGVAFSGSISMVY